MALIDSSIKDDGDYNAEVINQVEDVNQYTYDLVRRGMENMVNTNTRFDVIRKAGLQIAGKTGTAQESEDRPDHSYFTGFAPYDTPDIALTVVIPYGGGSSNAIPVFTDVVANYYGIELDTKH